MPKFKSDAEGDKLVTCLIKKLKLSKVNSFDTITKKLEDDYFDMIGDGVYKTVWSHKKFPNYVVKVYREAYGHKKDSYYVPKKLKKFYMYPIYKNSRFMVQHKVELSNTKKALSLIQEQFDDDLWDLYDVHDENVGWYKGKPVVIDFLTKGHQF